MDVEIDGIRYAPASNRTPNIGIAISTHNRHDVLSQSLEHQLKYLPAGALVAVVDDGSQPSIVVTVSVQLHRIEVSQGIVAAKNASISTLMSAGCEHLFLFDDELGRLLMAGICFTSNRQNRT